VQLALNENLFLKPLEAPVLLGDVGCTIAWNLLGASNIDVSEFVSARQFISNVSDTFYVLW
jgi:hypothetical protein